LQNRVFRVAFETLYLPSGPRGVPSGIETEREVLGRQGEARMQQMQHIFHILALIELALVVTTPVLVAVVAYYEWRHGRW
jgi:hypothetical protein